MAKKTITKAERLQLVGLLALADNHYDRLLEIERAAGDLLGIEGPNTARDHLSDMMWGDIGHNNHEELLRKLEINVVSTHRIGQPHEALPICGTLELGSFITTDESKVDCDKCRLLMSKGDGQ